MPRALLAVSALAALTALSCSRKTPSEIRNTSVHISQTATSPSPPQAPVIITNVQGPESVVYDPAQDVYFISNINGGELAVDGNGFISRVDAKTFKVDLKWIESGKAGVHLDGPKGMCLKGDALYVSDVTAVRKFDRRSGAPLRDISLPGATFINDLATDGRHVFVSDTGLKMGPGESFIGTGTDAIWMIDENDTPKKIAAGRELKSPNGLDVIDGKLWVVTFGSNELFQLDNGTKSHSTTLPQGELDGLAHRPDGTLLVASWKGNAVYAGPRGGPFKAILEAIDAPADICYDAVHHRLLVPHSAANEVSVHRMP